MHLRCMTFREHPPVKIAFGDGGMLHHASAMHDISGTSAGQNRLRRWRMLHHASSMHDINYTNRTLRSTKSQ